MFSGDKSNRFLGIRGKGIYIPLLISALVLLGGVVVMFLWNAIVPDILTTARPISFWQAAGLLVLSRLLVGGFSRFGGKYKTPAHMSEKWMNMSEEEKSKLREEWKQRCHKSNDDC